MKRSPDEDKRIRKAGLCYAGVEMLLLSRRRCGRGFTYHDVEGRRISDPKTLERLRGLAVPPAYTDVRLAPRADLHLQAVGRDEAGRLQYLYHPQWEFIREWRKEEKLGHLCVALPAIRRRLARALRRPGIDREKTLAAVTMLIDRTHIRIGCTDYVHSGRSRGAATLLKRNLRCEGERVHLAFRGKRRKPVYCSIYSPVLVRNLTELMDLPGRRLFQYYDTSGQLHPVSAGDVNRYLHEISGAEITAKDFRSLAATAAAAERLSAIVPAKQARARKRQVAEVIAEVAEMLANTPAVVRRSYVHRRAVDAFESGELARLRAAAPRNRGLSRGEALVSALFEAR